MVTEKTPFRGTLGEVMHQHQHSPLPLEELEGVPQPLVVLLEPSPAGVSDKKGSLIPEAARYNAHSLLGSAVTLRVILRRNRTLFRKYFVELSHNPVPCRLLWRLLSFRAMNSKLKELIRTILRRDGEGSLESLYGNYSACLRHLVGYLSQKDDSDRKALLAVLRNMAFNKHQDVGRPIDEATIAREMKNIFRKLLLQELETTTEEDVGSLYEAIEKGKMK
jgi:hypothetical protein